MVHVVKRRQGIVGTRIGETGTIWYTYRGDRSWLVHVKGNGVKLGRETDGTIGGVQAR